MNEAAFWSKRLRPLLLRACKGRPAHFERVENTAASGTPDVDYCVDGAAGKIELKYAPKIPKRPGSAVLGAKKGLRRSQVVWITRRVRAGGRVFVAIGSPSHVWVLDARRLPVQELRALGRYSVQQLDAAAVWSAQGRAADVSWLTPTLSS